MAKYLRGRGDAHQYILSIGKSIIIKQARLIVARLPSIKKRLIWHKNEGMRSS